jgi:processive 1,2-diacylglycerol beta-glucosyltransferase
MAPSPVAAAAAPAPTGPRAYRLTEVESGTTIGDLTEGQLQFLADELEEESPADRDYYIDTATIDMLAAAGADSELLAMLKRAVGSREGVEIEWTRL